MNIKGLGKYCIKEGRRKGSFKICMKVKEFTVPMRENRRFIRTKAQVVGGCLCILSCVLKRGEMEEDQD